MAEDAHRRFMTENALNTDAFPSLRRIQQDVVAIVGGWLNGGAEAAGFMTTGGTESILLAVEAARQRASSSGASAGRTSYSPRPPMPHSRRRAHYFGLENRRVAVRDDWRADVNAMAAAIDDDTVLIVGSAPQYPQGVIDPITDIAASPPSVASAATSTPAWAASRSPIWPASATRSRRSTSRSPASPPSRSTCTSSATRARAHRSSCTARGRCAVTRCSSPRTGSGAPTAPRGSSARGPADRWPRRGRCSTTWATTATCGWRARPEPPRRSWPAASVSTRRWSCGPSPTPCCSPSAPPIRTSSTCSPSPTRFWAKGWYVDRQGPPPSLHCTVNAIHAGRIQEFLGDLDDAVSEVATAGARGQKGAYGTVE